MSCPKVSVIIPIYGVEPYIERCARSLFEQTLQDIELIFVDDCSQDNSIAILERILKEYPERVPNTRILHHDKNKGLPIARHTGLLEARGEYIIHCDSDDWVLPETYQTLYFKAKETVADVVVFDIEETDGVIGLRRIVGARTTDINQFKKDMMYMRSSWSLINKLFKRNVYDIVIEYPQVGVGEDMALTLQLISACSTMAYISTPFYKYYVVNPRSMTHNISEIKALRRYEQDKANAEIVLRFYDRQNLIDPEFNDALNYLKWSVRKPIWGLIHKRKYFKLWKNTYPGVERRLLKSQNVTRKEKIQMLLSYLRLYPFKRDRIVL